MRAESGRGEGGEGARATATSLDTEASLGADADAEAAASEAGATCAGGSVGTLRAQPMADADAITESVARTAATF